MIKKMDSDWDEYDDDEYDEYPTSDEDSDQAEAGAPITASVTPSSTSAKTQKPAYALIKRTEVFAKMDEALISLRDMTGLTYTTLRILLNLHKWDQNRLLEKFYDSPERLFKEANIYQSDDDDSFERPTEEADCQICYDSVEPQHLVFGRCGHYFCKECYTEYARTHIKEGVAELRCPGHQCNCYVEDEVIFGLLERDQQTAERYRKQMAEAYVVTNRALLHCTTPDCETVLQIGLHDHNVGIMVECQCGETLCSSCGEKWHDPVKCQLLKMWRKKCDDDSETYNWIHANTKECPKCKATIEKDGGCNHVVCRNQSCRYEFCWVCMTGWELHGSAFYNCNRFDANGGNDKNKQESSRVALERYLFYYNRYHNHSQSLKKEGKLIKNIKRKMDNLMERDMSWVEVQFLQQAAETLKQSRQILMFTYVFAFYLDRSNTTEIFLDNQANLEQATETLSEYLERELPESDQDISKIKCLVQDRARYCSDRSGKLIEHVHEGYNNDQWQYRTENI